MPHRAAISIGPSALPLPNARAPYTLDPASTVRLPVDTLLTRFLSTKRERLHSIDALLDDAFGAIDNLVAAGGKRLRPAFVYWGHRAAGMAHHDAVIQVGAAVELLHTFALLHDDVMDRSRIRRGSPTAHASLAARHADDGLRGDHDWFGASAAILAGDLAHSWSRELLDTAALPCGAAARARRVFAELCEEVMAGQYLDLVMAGNAEPDKWTARRVALLKSARYSVTRPLLLGAAIGTTEPCPEVVNALQMYGDAVGVAFQIRDDMLGLFGETRRTGKSTLDDLREGKRTVLMLRALRLCDDDERRLIEASLGDPECRRSARRRGSRDRRLERRARVSRTFGGG